ncbi:MAG: phospholipid carrier-dependent glycosyltransferase, partial [Anaerolineae bacterium]|nr:phospholipid carrier-dependent glycosyltransferase [Anaerolineae bacterium]
IALYWQALRKIEVDYTVFVHLLDSTGRVLSQRDSQPQNGFRPTSTWTAGEEVADYHGLPLPADIPAGEYWLEVGLYEAATGKRLLTETRQEDRILLGPIRIMR